LEADPMTETSLTDLYRTDYVRFGRNEGYASGISDKKHGNPNFSSGKKKKEENNSEEPEETEYVDNSVKLNNALNSLAFFNMVSMRNLGKKSKNRIELFINEKMLTPPEIFNPFERKVN
jgi:hypothetical protein